MQVAVYADGELVIDACAGVTDRTTGQRVTGENLFTVYSVSKGITATAIHLLADRELLGYDDPVATYWPAFAVNGKSGITIRHLLTHSAGMVQIPEGIDALDQAHWHEMCARIAEERPLWKPGTQLSYHALTFGWILGQVVERVAARPFNQFILESVATPLDLEALFFGISEDELSRVATLYEHPDLLQAPPRPIPRAVPPGFLSAQTMNHPLIRMSCLPAHGMITNARSLAKFYASLIGNGIQGHRLLSSTRMEQATALQREGPFVPGGVPVRIALGYSLGAPNSAMGTRAALFGHGGYGGSFGFADPDFGVAIGFTKNHLTGGAIEESTMYRLVRVIRQALDLPLLRS